MQKKSRKQLFYKICLTRILFAYYHNNTFAALLAKHLHPLESTTHSKSSDFFDIHNDPNICALCKANKNF